MDKTLSHISDVSHIMHQTNFLLMTSFQNSLLSDFFLLKIKYQEASELYLVSGKWRLAVGSLLH